MTKKWKLCSALVLTTLLVGWIAALFLFSKMLIASIPLPMHAFGIFGLFFFACIMWSQWYDHDP